VSHATHIKDVICLGHTFLLYASKRRSEFRANVCLERGPRRRNKRSPLAGRPEDGQQLRHKAPIQEPLD
jgi:hypothetical protein